MKLQQGVLLLLLNVILITGCQDKPTTATAMPLDGVYEQIGYGRIVNIKDGEFQLYDITRISCLPVLEGSVSVFGDNLNLVNDTLKLKDGINTYQYLPITNLPALCRATYSDSKLNDPIFNFEVLAENFKDHYAYFELRNVNWDSLYNATKANITSTTSDAELYRILEDMLDTFNDGHIGLDAPSEVEEEVEALIPDNRSEDDEEDNEKEYGDFQIATMVAEHYLKDNMKSSRSGLIKWGFMEDNIAYLQINLMMGHGVIELVDSLQGMDYLRAYFDALEDLETSEQHTKLEVEGIRATLKTVMTDLETSKALVLDVRFNGGGKDEVGLEIMRHFNDKKRVVFSKKARLKDGFTPETQVYLEASPQPYTKPVFIMTSQESASATEIMVLSSLLLDNVYRLGSNTEGVFSDVMEKALPNGWEVGLSNEVYLDTKGTNYESIGIPPTESLDYAEDTQAFYRCLANDLEADSQKIVHSVKTILNQ